ncbi:MAG: citrate synthase [Acidimicrobiales bacterium]
MVETGSNLISAAEAATRLGVKRDTLYAYVSRGQIVAHQLPGRRGSFFEPEAIDRLVSRSRLPQTRRPDARITSAITLIEHGSYWYRGHDPAALARSSTFEQVAELLWVDADPSLATPPWMADTEAVTAAIAAQRALGPDPRPFERLSVIMPVLAAHDPLRHDLRPGGAAATARRLLAGTVAALGARGGFGASGRVRPNPVTLDQPRRGGSTGTGVAASLSGMLAGTSGFPRSRRRQEALLNQALVIMADHELAPSTVAVRIAAGVHSDPYAAVSAGLGAVSGSWHGAASRRVESLLWSIGGGATADAEFAALLQSGPPVAGFGQVLYPDGDPRGPILLGLAAGLGSLPEAEAVLAIAATQGLPAPNVDFALAALTHRMRLPAGAAETIFAIGRLAGWLAHAIEEYTESSDLRLRALYVGRRPRPAG